MWAFGDADKNIKIYANFKQCISYTRIIMKYAQRHDYIQKNHFDILEMPVNRELNKAKDDKRKEKYYPIELIETTKKLIQAECCQQTYTVFMLMYNLGAGKVEVYPLTWQDMNFENKTIALTHKLVKNKETKKFEPVLGAKNKYRPRIVSLNESTVALLTEWRATQEIMLEQLEIERTLGQFLFTYTNRFGEVNLPLHSNWLNYPLNQVTQK